MILETMGGGGVSPCMTESRSGTSDQGRLLPVRESALQLGAQPPPHAGKERDDQHCAHSMRSPARAQLISAFQSRHSALEGAVSGLAVKSRLSA